jgi:hypothetical protein
MVVTRQRRSEHVSAATNRPATAQELLEAKISKIVEKLVDGEWLVLLL